MMSLTWRPSSGCADQIEIYDDIPQQQVNEVVNRARVSLLWSRREGVNRAIIESMFAGVPCVLRDGFNYGYKYPYINERTACFTSETDLPQTLLSAIRDHDRYAPREWVAANMSCQLRYHAARGGDRSQGRGVR